VARPEARIRNWRSGAAPAPQPKSAIARRTERASRWPFVAERRISGLCAEAGRAQVDGNHDQRLQALHTGREPERRDPLDDVLPSNLENLLKEERGRGVAHAWVVISDGTDQRLGFFIFRGG
jgi:hypothetical protein